MEGVNKFSFTYSENKTMTDQKQTYRTFAMSESDSNNNTMKNNSSNLRSHNYFMYRLSEEIRKAIRLENSFSIMFIQFTDLNELNHSDSPHQKQYIYEMGKEIRKTLRAYDIACTNKPFQGDDSQNWELELLLPDTQWEEAESIAKRMLNILTSTSLHIDETTSFSSEVALGLAGFPENGQSRTQLMDTACDALSQARSKEDSAFASLVPDQMIEEQQSGDPFHKQVDQPWKQQIIGQSSEMQENVFQVMEQIVPTNFNVIVEGEPGTGKELISRAIHEDGPRGKHPFVSINCSKYSVTLLEQKLFGTVEESSSSEEEAENQSLIQQADGGTLFLEEISEMSKGIQAQLLRVLETGEVRPVGSSEAYSVDIRIICSSSRSIKQLLETGEFRRELYYRLNDSRIELPPLRERIEDIPQLIDYFLEELAYETDQPKMDIEEGAIRKLMKRSWIGNVKELRNEVRRLALTSDDQLISASDIKGEDETSEDEPSMRDSASSEEEQYKVTSSEETGDKVLEIPLPEQMKTADLKIWKERATAKIDRMSLKEALNRTDGDRMKASEILDLHFTSVYRKIREYDIEA